MKPIKVFNQSMELVAFLEQAFNIGYETPFNGLWTASFMLPAGDEKNGDCRPFNFVELYDDIEYIGLFRILPSAARRSDDGATITYKCEHVLSTLLDDLLFQFHTVGNSGYDTAQVISYVLTRQAIPRWQLGSCDFTAEYEYTWENENLLSALFSIPKPFVNEYSWSWDTLSYPWTLSLAHPPQGVETYIRYGVNLRGVERTDDPTGLATRLYCLGYGEGVNQLTISEVNGGFPYLDADTQAQYGIISKTWVDRSIENAETLKARGQALLDQLKMPRVTYSVDAAELYAITQDPIDKFRVGTQVRVIDEELGIDFVSRVVNYRKGDIFGDPGSVSLEIANRVEDIATSAADLQRRQRIAETHAQGATNVNVYNLAENCDPTHPAILRIWVPDEAVRINKLLLSYEVEAFRGYTRSLAAAPATTTNSGGEATPTTSTENVRIVSSGGNLWYPDPGFTSGFDVTSNDGTHNHGIPNGTVLLIQGGGSITFNDAGGHRHVLADVNHSHSVTIPAHNHTVIIPEHSHGIPAHTHEIEHGIFEGPTPTAILIRVDEVAVPGTATSGNNIDLVPFLEKDEEGKIKRGVWHTISIVPNSLGRVVVAVVAQVFVQSRGGGNY